MLDNVAPSQRRTLYSARGCLIAADITHVALIGYEVRRGWCPARQVGVLGEARRRGAQQAVLQCEVCANAKGALQRTARGPKETGRQRRAGTRRHAQRARRAGYTSLLAEGRSLRTWNGPARRVKVVKDPCGASFAVILNFSLNLTLCHAARTHRKANGATADARSPDKGSVHPGTAYLSTVPTRYFTAFLALRFTTLTRRVQYGLGTPASPKALYTAF